MYTKNEEIKDLVKKEVFEAVEELSKSTGLSVWSYIDKAYDHYKSLNLEGRCKKINAL